MQGIRTLISGTISGVIAVSLLIGCTPTSQVDASLDAPEGAAVTRLGEVNVPGYLLEDSIGGLMLPYGVAVAADGTGYLVSGVSDNRSVARWDVKNQDWQVIGAERGSFDAPQQVEVASDGTVFVANAGDSSVSVGSADGLTWTKITAETGGFNDPSDVAVAAGGAIVVANAGDGSLSIKTDEKSSWINLGRDITGLSVPLGVDVTDDGTIYVTDHVADSLVVSRDGGSSWTTLDALTGGFDGPVAVDAHADGTVYVSNLRGKSISRSRDHGESWRSVAGFNELYGLAVDDEGAIYVTDGVNSAGRFITTSGVAHYVTAARAEGDSAWSGANLRHQGVLQ